MDNFYDRNKTFFGIIIGAVIIGGFIYLGLQDNEGKKVSDVLVAPGAQNSPTSVGLLQETDSKTNSVACGETDNTIVTKVIDGDTVVVEGGYHIRLLGMDADESGYSCYLPAKTRLEELVLGKMVKLEKDKTDLDQYGRCLRYIFLGNTNVGVQLVKEGLAIARFYEPDVKYKTEISDAEKQAQISGIGCKWARQ